MNSLDPDLAGHFVGPDLGPVCKGYKQMQNNHPCYSDEFFHPASYNKVV